MDGGGYLRLLRRRWRVVTYGVLLGGLLAVVLTLLTTPQYESSSQAFVSVRSTGDSINSQDTNPILNANQASQFSIERVRSYVNIVDSSTVTSAVVTSLKLPMAPAQLAKKLTVSAPENTVLIDITVRDSSPQRAQAIALAVDEAFAQTVANLESSPGVTSPVTITFVRQPIIPEKPVSPQATLNLALGLIAGLMLGLGAAVTRDSLDTSVRTSAELEALTGNLPLGAVPNDPSCRLTPMPPPGGRSAVRGESYERLRTNLHFVPVPPRSLVITSPVDGEGKTVTAANVALVLARVGVRVALVEADLRRPRLGEYLSLPVGDGLSEVLTGRASLRDALHRWGDENLPLWALTSGAIPADPNELLCSEQMLATLIALSDQVDLVLIDTPALLSASDAAILAKLTDGAVVVVHSGKTTREQLSTALASLVTLDAQVYGTVLNRVRRSLWTPRRDRRSPAERGTPPARHATQARLAGGHPSDETTGPANLPPASGSIPAALSGSSSRDTLGSAPNPTRPTSFPPAGTVPPTVPVSVTPTHAGFQQVSDTPLADPSSVVVPAVGRWPGDGQEPNLTQKPKTSSRSSGTGTNEPETLGLELPSAKTGSADQQKPQ